MPELPEVETVKLFLNSHLTNKKVKWARIENKKLRYEIPSKICKIIVNSKITKINRRGKYLIFLFDNNFSMLIHLGMTGCFRASRLFKFRKHDHFSIGVNNKVLTFNDVRKFGFIKIYKTSDIYLSSHLKYLGPEPFSKEMKSSLLLEKAKRVSIKSFLMNQKYIAGLGNIYCSEILYESKISPKRMAFTINEDEMKFLIRSMRKILKKAIKCGGSSVKDFNVSDEKVGYFNNELKVYDRNGRRCYRCKKYNLIKKIIQNGRSTFYCVKCQK